jgi:hypothetical protein
MSLTIKLTQPDEDTDDLTETEMGVWLGQRKTPQKSPLIGS